MEEHKLTEREKLFLNIIQQYSPQHFEYKPEYGTWMVVDICNIVWDTAIQDIEKTHDCFVKNINKSITGLEDIILANDKQIQSQLSKIEILQEEIDELKSNIEELKLNHKQELQIAYEEGRDDYADYIDSLPHSDFE